MTNFSGHASSWESISGRPGLSRGITSFITDCAVPSWWVSSWEKPGRISRVALQEVSSGHSDRSCVSISVFHSWEDQARSSSHFWVACWREAFHKIVHGNSSRKLSFGLCRYQVSLIATLSQLLYSRDFDFHNFSSPGSLKSRMIRATAPLQ